MFQFQEKQKKNIFAIFILEFTMEVLHMFKTLFQSLIKFLLKTSEIF